MADLTMSVAYFGLLLGIGVILASVLKKRRIPDAFFLLILGLILGPTLYNNPYVMDYITMTLVQVDVMEIIPNFLRLLAIIFIVFTGTFNLGFRAFKRFSNTGVNLAIVGVIFNTIVIGFVAHLLFGMELVFAFLLAAIISGTGISVIFTFEDVLKGSKRAINILKIESIFNSPLSVLLPMVFLGLVAMEPGALFEPMQHLSNFWLMLAAGVGTGIIMGLAVSKILKSVMKQYTALLLFAIALITYALAEIVGGSGLLAVAICGLIAGDLVIPGRRDVERFDDHLSELLRISVFTLLGASVALFMSPQQFIITIIFFLIVFFIRPVFLLPTLGKKRKEFSRKDLVLLSFVTPRGISAAAMAPLAATALIVAGQSDTVAAQIVNITFMVILLSILFSTVVAAFVHRAQGPKEKKTKDVLSSVEKAAEKKKEKSEEEILEEVEGKGKKS